MLIQLVAYIMITLHAAADPAQDLPTIGEICLQQWFYAWWDCLERPGTTGDYCKAVANLAQEDCLNSM
ncbi:MAG: hypothetical protein DCC75_04475 [Proteobacteria bacterium]|nr:MAG: hypothetical protein DCC75_04475 [Pseudomonadota bacterium]